MNDYDSLTIHTYGVCTHFRQGVVSGIPHRVVLPDARVIRAGQLEVLDVDVPHVASYELLPHFARFKLRSSPQVTIPGLITDGWIEQGVRLQVINCVERNLGDDGGMPKLTDYVAHYSYSGDVVLHGRAMCYLDVYGGKVTWHQPDPAKAGWVTITMETEGLPKLLVTPLASSAGQSYVVTLAQSETISLMNLELEDDDQTGGEYDFLLHYLTARGGIPPAIRKLLPGMPGSSSSLHPARVAQAMNDLAAVLQPSALVKRQCEDPGDLTPSCSPSGYP